MSTQSSRRPQTPTLGTRGSPLALAQAHAVRTALIAHHGDWPDTAVPIEVIRTTGDAILDRPLAEIGGKGLFTKEIEHALLDGSIDFAVHSMKDMPTELPRGLIITAVTAREDPRDAWIARDPAHTGPWALPPGAVVGTASLRRQAWVRAQRPDLKVVTLRGNVGTRLDKLASGQVDAMLLAAAGLNRLGMADRATALLSLELAPPALAQGAVGLESRVADTATRDLLAPLNDAETAARITAERAVLARLDGSCRTPIAGLATLSADGTAVHIAAHVYAPDGTKTVSAQQTGPVAEAEALGRTVGDRLAVDAADILAALGARPAAWETTTQD